MRGGASPHPTWLVQNASSGYALGYPCTAYLERRPLNAPLGSVLVEIKLADNLTPNSNKNGTLDLRHPGNSLKLTVDSATSNTHNGN